MVPHRVSEWASQLELILTPYRSADGVQFVRIRRRLVELADIREAELAAWLDTHAVQIRNAAAKL